MPKQSIENGTKCMSKTQSLQNITTKLAKKFWRDLEKESSRPDEDEMKEYLESKLLKKYEKKETQKAIQKILTEIY